MRKPEVLSATIPGGQHSFGCVLRRSMGQQIAGVLGTMPMFPRRIGIAHFVRGGQHTCDPPGPEPLTQHDRLFGQQPASPQQREVRRSQHFVPHSSSFCWQRLQRPVRSLAHRHLGGQHLSRPHHARPVGQRRSQNFWDAVPTRIVLHSSFGLQHLSPQPLSPCLQHSLLLGFAQNSSGLQQSPPHGFLHSKTHAGSPGLPQRVSGGHAMTPVSVPSASLKQQHVEPATPHSLLQFPGFDPRQSHRNGNGGLHCFGSQSVGALACADARPGRSPAGTVAATRVPPRIRIARPRGIGVASDRASPSRNSVTALPAPCGDRYRSRAERKLDGLVDTGAVDAALRSDALPAAPSAVLLVELEIDASAVTAGLGARQARLAALPGAEPGARAAVRARGPDLPSGPAHARRPAPAGSRASGSRAFAPPDSRSEAYAA